MAYLTNGTGDGTLYIGTVKWSNDYKHIMQFSSLSARNQFFTNNFTLLSSTVVYLNPNKYIDIDGKIKNIDTKNYCFFKNDSEIGSSISYCCFITDYEYIAPKTTRLYVELDVFQTYFYNTTFYNSFIERGHVASDNLNEWTAPEPISLSPQYSKQLTYTDNNSWTVAWLLNSISLPDQSNNFIYGGMGASDKLTGCFSFALASHTDLQNYLQSWTQGTIDHRSDIINLTAIPLWLLQQLSFTQQGVILKDNDLLSTSFSVNIDTNSLINGYTPKNKKLLTSLGRTFALYNKNGFCKTIVPELLTANTITVTMKARPIGLTAIKMSINNYNGDVNENFDFPYFCQLPVGYNANSGVSASIDKMNAVFGTVGKAFGGVNSSFNFTQGANFNNKLASTATVASGVTLGADLFMQGTSSGFSLAQAFEDRAGGSGGAVDTIGISPEFIKPRFVEINPLVEDCIIADNFLTTYGYTINELRNPTSWFHTRTYWNYIKTQNINLNGNCPANYEQKLKDIFNSGTTLWHNYSDFGDYTKSNTII